MENIQSLSGIEASQPMKTIKTRDSCVTREVGTYSEISANLLGSRVFEDWGRIIEESPRKSISSFQIICHENSDEDDNSFHSFEDDNSFHSSEEDDFSSLSENTEKLSFLGVEASQPMKTLLISNNGRTIEVGTYSDIESTLYGNPVFEDWSRIIHTIGSEDSEKDNILPLLEDTDDCAQESSMDEPIVLPGSPQSQKQGVISGTINSLSSSVYNLAESIVLAPVKVVARLGQRHIDQINSAPALKAIEAPKPTFMDCKDYVESNLNHKLNNHTAYYYIDEEEPLDDFGFFVSNYLARGSFILMTGNDGTLISATGNEERSEAKAIGDSLLYWVRYQLGDTKENEAVAQAALRILDSSIAFAIRNAEHRDEINLDRPNDLGSMSYELSLSRGVFSIKFSSLQSGFDKAVIDGKDVDVDPADSSYRLSGTIEVFKNGSDQFQAHLANGESKLSASVCS